MLPRNAPWIGQTVEMDNQGRVLIPARLRGAAGLTGDVDVQGHVTYLVVLNRDRSQARTQASALSVDDKGRLSAFGI